jgi:signal recognition particle subunit SRP54
MMDEISRVHKAIQPHETLFVVDAMTGQDAVNTAKAFNDILNFDGVILTKLDGDTRGGAAISIKTVVNKPIKFVGTGEDGSLMCLSYSYGRTYSWNGRCCVFSRKSKNSLMKKLEEFKRKSPKTNLVLMIFLPKSTGEKMGNMKDLVGMIPGASKAMKDVEIEDDAFKHIEAIIHSMTPSEQ